MFDSAMAWVETALFLILLYGVLRLIKELVKRLFDRQALEAELKELQSTFQEYQSDMVVRLERYKNTIAELEDQINEYTDSNSKTMDQTDYDVAQISNLVHQLMELNDELFIKISFIDQCLSTEQPPTGKQINDFKTMIQSDISHKLELKKEYEIFEQQILERNQQRHSRMLHRDMGLEL
ncbi:hypothetical protein [Caproiciproducens galactitolivorans]|uniref:Uncharacterized protein n=1 Tax=Caproiciproducens galactitolivorans TaxID=642589 RepID=A0ABT4BU07_9FIRM|nr:hypothetical protein [Caproiciproducens galactitolivorans]MCY1713383.1 hypothetical protein [Caproiciproducens galactitolivorans]